jgi:hypothetical protein
MSLLAYANQTKPFLSFVAVKKNKVSDEGILCAPLRYELKERLLIFINSFAGEECAGSTLKDLIKVCNTTIG